jgi:ATP-binding cassette, subfamily B, bacterial
MPEQPQQQQRGKRASWSRALLFLLLWPFLQCFRLLMVAVVPFVLRHLPPIIRARVWEWMARRRGLPSLKEKHPEYLPLQIPIWSYTVRSLRYALPYRRLMASSGLLIVFGSVFSLLTPWPLQFLVDYVLGHRPLPHVTALALGPFSKNVYALLVIAAVAGFVVTLGQYGLGVVDNYVNTKLEQSMVLDFRSDLFQHSQSLSLAYHDQKRAGDFMARINLSSSAVGALPGAIPGLAQSVISLVGMFSVVFLLDRELALLSLVVVPFLFYATRFYSKRIVPQMVKVKAMEGESMAIVHEAISMIRIMIAFVREEYEFRRFRTQGKSAVDARIKVTVKQTVYSLAVNGITSGGNALVLGFGAYRVLKGDITIGELLVVMTYVQSIYSPLETISTTVGSLQEQYVSLHRCFEILDVRPDIQDAPHAVPIERSEGHVEYRDISFSYSKRNETLADISFEVQPGQVVAIVGPTGAGKSTLISLLPRFYDPSGGQIFLDGRPTKDITLKSLRSQISLVLQEPLLFSGTIADNILYGRAGATMEDVYEAAKSANAHDFIERMPDGYGTVLGERGLQLSGGERQRISVARAFLKDAPILILDEPTSSIDSRTEAVILDALDLLMVGRTTFMIAHRLSTIRHADVILVLHDGRIVEQGTHDELLLRDGLYRQLYQVQTNSARRHAKSAIATVPREPQEESA